MMTRKIKTLLAWLLSLSMLLNVGAASAGTLIMPSGLIRIGEEAFCGDTSLDEVVLSDGTTYIGPRAFADSSLNAITLPESLEFIADDAFSGVTDLTVTAPEGSYAYGFAVEHGLITPDDEPTSPDYPESSHPYENNADLTWDFCVPGATWLRVRFSGDTLTEIDRDFIYIYDMSANQIGCYTGDQLADQSVLIPGEGFRIRLVSDSSNTEYGFDINYIAVSTDAVSIVMDHCGASPVPFDSGVPMTWSFDTLGKNPPFTYEYMLMKYLLNDNGEEEPEAVCTLLSESSTVSFTAPDPGIYYLFVTVTDTEGNVNDFISRMIEVQSAEEIDSLLANRLLYQTNGVDRAIITDVDWTGPLFNMNLPAEVDGLPVYGIGSNAFDGWTELSGTLTVPEGVDWIGPRAFADTALTSVILPASLTEIASDAFDGLTITHFSAPVGSYAYSYGVTQGWIKAESSFPESAHPCEGDTDLTWEYTVPGAWAIRVTFSRDTYFDKYTDFLYLYNSEDTFFWECTGDQLAGRTVTIPGDNVSFQLITSSDTSAYGFKVVDISAIPNTTILGAVYPSDLEVAIEDAKAVTWTVNASGYYGQFSYYYELMLDGEIYTYGESSNPEFTHVLDQRGKFDLRVTVTDCEGNSDVFWSAPVSVGSKLGQEELIAANLTYTLDSAGNAAVTGITNTTGIYDLIIPAQLDGHPVTAIADDAFVYLPLTGHLVIPEGVTSIGASAFRDTNLSGSLVLPSTLNSIGAHAFSYNSSFTGDLVIPQGLTIINDCVFNSCTGFNGTLTIPEGVTAIGECAFEFCGFTGTLTLPSTLTTIDGFAFSHCSGFTGSLTIPEGVTDIGRDAFAYCGFTGDLVLPSTLSIVNEWTFAFCADMAGSIVIPEGLTFLGTNSFANSGFTGDLILPSTLKTVGTRAFLNCTGLAGRLVLPEGVSAIGANAFDSCSFTGPLELPSTLYYLGAAAFKNCAGLTGPLTVPGPVLDIDEYVFSGCAGLSGKLTLPEGIRSIAASAFAGTSLVSVSFPESLTSIDDQAFAGSPVVQFTAPEGSFGYDYALAQGWTYVEPVTGVLRMCTNATFPPYVYYDDAIMRGVDVSIAQAIADKLGMRLIVSDISFGSCLPGVMEGTYDLCMGGITVTSERLQILDFSDTYVTNRQVLVVPQGSPITSVNDLLARGAAYSVGTVAFGTADLYFYYDYEDAGKNCDELYHTYPTGSAALQALCDGQLDCVIIDAAPASEFAATHSGVKVLSMPYVVEDYAVAVAKGNTTLLSAINAALTELRAEGTLDAIIARYINLGE